MPPAAFIALHAQVPVTTSGQGNPVISGAPNQANGPVVLDSSGNASFPGKVTAGTMVLPAWVDPRAYGAKCDGVTNDATALQNAITAAYGGVLSLPSGATCAFASQLNITSALTVQGYGATLKKTANVAGLHVASGADGFVLEGFTLESSAATGTADGIVIGDADATNGSSGTLRDLTVLGQKGNGINIRNGGSGVLDSIQASQNLGHGVLIDNQNTNAVNVNAWHIRQLTCYGNGGDGLHLGTTAANVVTGLVSEGNSGAGLSVNYPGNQIQGYVEANTGGPLTLGSSAFHNVITLRSVGTTAPAIANSFNWIYFLNDDANVSPPQLSYNGIVTFYVSPTAPTASQGDNSTNVATTAYVDTGLSGKAASSAATTVDFQPCALGANCNTVFKALDLSGQTASIGSTDYYVPANAGTYRITLVLNVTTAGTGGTVTATAGWNSGNTTATSPAVSLSNPYSSTAFTTVAQVNANKYHFSYSTTVSGATGNPQYALQIYVERLN